MNKIVHNRNLMDYSLYPIWFRTADHFHPQETVKGRFMHQILLILGGSGRLIYRSEVYPLKKGCAFFLRENCFAEYIDEGGLKSAFLTVKGPAADHLAETFAPDGFLFYEDIEPETYQYLIKQLVDCYQNEGDQAKLSAMAYSIFVKFLSESKNKTPKNLDTVVAYINKNFYRKLTLKEIADHCYISVSKLCHDFKDFYGTSVFDYILNLRLENADSILHSESEVMIKDVALRCGFTDSGYFCKTYKRKYGKTPTGK